MMNKEQLINEFTRFAKRDVNQGLSLITGMFVALCETMCELSEADSDKTIRIIEANGGRNITIHAVKAHADTRH